MNQPVSPTKLQQWSQLGRGDPQASPADTRSALEQVAIETGTPVEILFAMGEAAGAQSPQDFQGVARRVGQTLGPRFQAGETVEDVVRSFAGDDEAALSDFMAQARQINRQLYPDDWKGFDERRGVGDLLARGAADYPREIMRGIGRGMEIAGLKQSGRALVDFADGTLGQDDVENERDAAIQAGSTIWQEIIDGFWRAVPGIAGDIGAGVGGAVAGAAAGGAVAGPPGALVGGALGAIAGAAASIVPAELASSWDAAERGGRDVSDPETQAEIVGATIAKSIAQTVFPAGISRTLMRPVEIAAQATVRNTALRAAKGAAVGSLTEGTAETMAVLVDAVMFDPETRAAVDDRDLAALGPLLLERHGREAIVSFGVGALMGAGIGGPTEGYSQFRTNRTIEQDIAAIPDPAQPIWQKAVAEADAIAGPGRDAFLRGVLNEVNGTEAKLTDPQTGQYDSQGRSAQQQRQYDRGVAWAQNEAMGIVSRMNAATAPKGPLTSAAEAAPTPAPVAVAAPPEQPREPVGAVEDERDRDDDLFGTAPTGPVEPPAPAPVAINPEPQGDAIVIPPPGGPDDALRARAIREAVRQFEAMQGGVIPEGGLTVPERRDIIARLEAEGGDVEDAIVERVTRTGMEADGMAPDRGPAPDLSPPPARPMRPLRMPEAPKEPAPAEEKDRGPAPDLRPQQPARTRPLDLPPKDEIDTTTAQPPVRDTDPAAGGVPTAATAAPETAPPSSPKRDLGPAPSTATPAAPMRPMAMPEDAWSTSLIRARQKAKEVGLTKEEAGDAWGDLPALVAAVRAKESPVAAAAAEADPEPTEAQKEAGNYRKGHVKFQGLDITIENAKGSERRGRAADGTEWSVTMPAHYGYVKRTEGADGDQVDVYIGDDETSTKAYIIDQYDPKTGKFDEHKAVLGARNVEDAHRIYDAGFSDGSGPRRRRGTIRLEADEFKAWATEGDTSKPLAGRPESEFMPKPKGDTAEGSPSQVTTPPSPNLLGKLDQTEEGRWWNTLPDEDKASVLRKAGYEQGGGAGVPWGILRKETRDQILAVRGETSGSPDRAAPTPAPDAAQPEAPAPEPAPAAEPTGDEAPTPPAPATAPTPLASEYGAKNTLVTKDRAAELRARLKAKLDGTQLNAGIDPEILSIGAELAVFHIEAGARKFADLVRAIAADLDMEVSRLRPYARSWYNGARDMMEDAGLDVGDMDGSDAVRAQMAGLFEAQEASDAGTPVRGTGDQQLAGEQPGPVSQTEEGGDAEPARSGSEPVSGGTGGGTDAAGDGQASGGRTGAAGDGVRAPKSGGADGGRRVGKPRKGKSSPTGAAPVEAGTAESPGAKAAKAAIPAVNFTITDDLRLGQGGLAEKFADNMAAIRLLKQIEAENRRATPDEQMALARYVGWGGMKNAFRTAGAADGAGIAKGWEARVAEVEALLDAKELAAARNSVKAAHYTSETVTRAVWKAAERLGFKGGAVLEPSAGSGNFLGLMPTSLRGVSPTVAVEYDSITARIAKLLYPASEVLHSGFEKLPIPAGRFALAIGNPPFGRDSLYFQNRPEVNGRTIHNQFFLASMHALAPDGILAMVVTHNFMDAQNTQTRADMARMGDLVGGIRLPSNAFEQNARTEVVTDLLFFRKRSEAADGVVNAAVDLSTAADMSDMQTMQAIFKRHKVEGVGDQEASLSMAREFAQWVPSDRAMMPAEDGTATEVSVNPYFMRNRRAVIGTMDASGTMNQRADLNVTMENPAEFAARLNEAIDRLPEQRQSDAVAERTQAAFARMAESLRLAVRGAEPGNVRVDQDGALKIVVDLDGDEGTRNALAEIDLTENTPFSVHYGYAGDGAWLEERDVTGPNGKPVKQMKDDGTPSTRNLKEVARITDLSEIPSGRRWGAKRVAMVRDMLPVRDALRRQLQLEAQDAPSAQIEANRQRLNDAYDAYVARHGRMHGARDAEALVNLMPDGGLVLAVETATDAGGFAGKAPIMSERVVRPPQAADKAADAGEAVALSMSTYGRIDLPHVAKLLGTDEAGAIEAISEGKKPRAYFDPETERWEPVDAYLSGMVRKKLHAAQAAGLEKNVAALEAVLPKKWDSTQVSPILGSSWVPPQVYGDFVKHLGYDTARVLYNAATNTYSVLAQGRPAAAWATSGAAFDASAIVDRMLNSKPLKVTYTDSEGKTHVDEEATAESQQKGAEIYAEFQDWAFADDTRREALVDLFNERYNTRVIRQRDGSFLKLPGSNTVQSGIPKDLGGIDMRPHQMNAVWRGITDPAVLFDHVVGAGKTFAAIARVMERRRMGLSRKPMIVVPNHLIEQWAADFKLLYPGANVLAGSKADFKKENRRRLFAKIAAGDYDAVIVGHSSFGFISLDPATETRYLEEELRVAMEAVTEAEQAAAEAGIEGSRGRKPFNVAEAERLVTKIETRLAKLRAGRRDRLLTFEEMGVDDLTVDEAHEFKNLSYSSNLVGVSGMGNKTGSQKAMDLHLKLRSLHDRPGASVAFLTGTPISNSVAEMYLVLRNLVPKELRDMGIEHFDAWRSMFVSYSSAFEPTEAGGVKEVTRLGREWNNMRALMDLYYSVADAVSLDDIKADYAATHDGEPFPVPPVKSQKESKKDREAVAVEPTEAQRAILSEIVSGFDGLPSISDPKERNGERLRLMDRARKVSLDARAVDPSINVPPGTGKIGAVVDNVTRIWKATEADRGAQIVFLDRSVPKAKGDEKIVKEYDDLVGRLDKARAEADEAAERRALDALEGFDVNDIEARRQALQGGWNAYDEIKRQLVAKGIPEGQIRFIQEAANDDQKAEMFRAVRAGDVRVLIGSTPRMGAGTNVQERLVALHHVDVTWKPSDIEQREGRIIRQKNALLAKYGHDKFAVEILAYVTEMTVDAKMWDLNSQKLRAINGIRKYDGAFSMEFEDEEAASMAEMAALATGNPLMVERVVLDSDLKKLDLQRRSFNNRRNGIRAQLNTAKRILQTADRDIGRAETFADVLEKAHAEVEARAAKRRVTIGGKAYGTEDAAIAAAGEMIAEQRGDKETARWKLAVDGVDVTTMDDLKGRVKAALGEPGLEIEVGGETFTRRWPAAGAIANKLAAEKARQAGNDTVSFAAGTLKGIPIEVDLYKGAYDSGERMTLDINLVHEGEVITFSQSQVDNKSAMQQVFYGALERLVRYGTADSMRARVDNTRRQKADAERDVPGLEAEAQKAWPKQAEYEQKAARLQEVVGVLSADSESERSARASPREMRTPLAPIRPAQVREATAAVNREIERSGLGSRVTARVVEGLLGALGQPILGRAEGAMIEVNAEAADPAGVARHEIVHVLRDSALWGKPYGLFEQDEWRSLVRAARADTALMESIEAAYPDLSDAGRVEEAVAEMYREFAQSREGRGPLARLFERMRDFFRAVGAALRGQGLTEAADVMKRMERGKIGRRSTTAMLASGVVSTGAEQRINTDTPAFKAWFGDSKVVDAEGKPLVVYHGTTADFEAFDPGMSAPRNQDKGMHFTEETERAGRFAATAPNGRVLPVYLSIKNPLVVTDGARFLVDMDKKGIGPWNFVKHITDQGHDGIHYVNAQQWVAFRPEQIKSIFNRGTWDAESPRIMESRSRELRFLNRLPRARDAAAVDANEATIIDRLSKASSSTLTDAMGGVSDRYNLLAIVPGRALFQEIGKAVPSAQAYLRTKEEMDALRNEWHATTDKVARDWQKAIADASGSTILSRGRKKAAAKVLADLMHDATIAGLDPAERFRAPQRRDDMRDADYARFVDESRARYAELRERWQALPDPLKQTYVTVRDTFKRMAEEVENAVADAAAKAMDLQADRVRARLDEELQRIRDEGMQGQARQDAEDTARRQFRTEIGRLEATRASRVRKLRLKFEQNRVEEPYFPLMRWGNYFVTVRDDTGKMVSFSKFQRAAQQEAFAAEMRGEGFTVQTGIMAKGTDMTRYVDPGFVADIQEMLGGDAASAAMQDAIWQRWLETLPDYSIRKSRIHRKGTPGYDGDALRAFAHQMFHGAHQLARLKHGMDLTKHLEKAQREARVAPDPTRAQIVVNEMGQRHEWIMNPQGSPWAAAATSAAFVWYLGVTPAAAVVNLSQTTVVGVPVLTAGIEGATVGKTVRHLTRALRDFTDGKGWAEKSARLSGDERDALQEAYRRGTIDKSQAHDLASVAESGVEYSGVRERIMRPIAFFFHHAERLNREVTFLAAYRMARDAGMDTTAAVQKASDLTWKAHFDYSSSSRPRFIQSDIGKVLFVFRNFQINMVYRLWRDLHQSLHGADEATRKEARAQLIGITASMFLHAGITGTWGYALMVTLLGLFFDGGSDELEEEMKRGIVETLGRDAGGMLLKGVPGHLTGADLSQRIGLPELWFRAPDRQLEGQAAYQFWLEQLVGAVPAMASGAFRGLQWASEGDVWRGIETAGPKFLRDHMRAVRYLREGVTTRSGEPVVEDLTPMQALTQAIGFTPAEVSERYEMNRRMRNMEERVSNERRRALRAAHDDIKDGGQISERTVERIRRFNEQNPTWVITADSVRQSIRSRQRMGEQMEAGIRLTPRLDGTIRSQMAPTIYGK